MEAQPVPTIPHDQRTLALLTHLSGLAGYLVPCGGVVVPIVIWAVKKDSPVISGIAKQALLLNLVVYLLAAATAILLLTVVLIPLVVLFWLALFIAALVLPIVGAVRASEGLYYRYPIVGVSP